MGNDRYLVKILLIASKKAIITWEGKVAPSTKDQWLIVEDIFLMEKLTNYLKTTGGTTGRTVRKLTLCMIQNGNIRTELQISPSTGLYESWKS